MTHERRPPALPETISEAARTALAKPRPPAPKEICAHRALCDSVQRDLGAIQLERYQVGMHDDVIAGVPVRIFTPRAVSGAGRVLLNLHGGGFGKDSGSITENVPIAALTETRVVATRYRLAPEYPFPHAVDDAEAVYRSLLESHAARSIGLYGTSAGGLLCTQLLVRLQARGVPLPRFLGFFSSSADLSRAGDSEYQFAPPDDPRTLAEIVSDYIAGHDVKDPALSPIFAPLSGFPPTLCIAGGRDILLSQTALFHQALLRAGAHAEFSFFEAMPHAHWAWLDLPESDEAFRQMAAFFIRQFGKSDA